MTITTTQLANPANGVNGGVFATITQDTVANVLDVTYFLTTPSGAANGTIQADYTVSATTGALTVRDTVFALPTGAVIATYYGNEATNPIFLANPKFVPANPGLRHHAIHLHVTRRPGAGHRHRCHRQGVCRNGRSRLLRLSRGGHG